MTITALDFDAGTTWIPQLRAGLSHLLPDDVDSRLIRAKPEGPWTAQTALCRHVDPAALVAAVRHWLIDQDVLLFHGTRVSEKQLASIRSDGLKLLIAADRFAAISEFLDGHRRWREIAPRLEEAIGYVASRSGGRVGRVHAGLSRSGMLRACNHYLVEGSEFDHHVAKFLLGEECHEQNRARGRAALVQFRISGAAALAAANPFGELGEVPNLVREVIGAMAYAIATRDNDTERLEADCAFVFETNIPSQAIQSIETISDDSLWRFYDNRLR
jgi:hypothetical protein